MGISGVTLPPDPIQQQPTYERALAAFEQLPPVRILFDNGAGGSPGQPYPGFERSFSRFPIPGTTARSWYLGRGGALGQAADSARGSARSGGTPSARPLTNFTGRHRRRRERPLDRDAALSSGSSRPAAARRRA